MATARGVWRGVAGRRTSLRRPSGCGRARGARAQAEDAGGGGEEATSTAAAGPKPATKLGVRAYWRAALEAQLLEHSLGARAGSVLDAHVLRRKGHLKEQDAFIDFLIDLHRTHTAEEVADKLERWVAEHLVDHRTSTLRRLVPQIGKFFTALPMRQALSEYDSFARLTLRRYVLPNFAEMRHLLGLAQVHASAPNLKLITFDADGTLYDDGHHFEHDNRMISQIIAMLDAGIDVGIVTAAGYPGEPERFEQRLHALLDAFRELKVPPRLTRRFHVMGGECNYLLRVTDGYGLAFVRNSSWQTADMLAWDDREVEKFLDRAEACLRGAAKRLGVAVDVVRKERAVGVVPVSTTTYELLEEIALTAQNDLASGEDLPFCAFNGGADVFVDVGSKNIGLNALMKHLNCGSSETLHVGDRFTVTGNDNKVRGCCSILWVANPDETSFFIKVLLRDLAEMRSSAS